MDPNIRVTGDGEHMRYEWQDKIWICRDADVHPIIDMAPDSVEVIGFVVLNHDTGEGAFVEARDLRGVTDADALQDAGGDIEHWRKRAFHRDFTNGGHDD
jgi:hypothetical protein